MSTIERRPSAQTVEPSPEAAVSDLTIRWAISRSALVKVRPDLVRSRGVGSPRLELGVELAQSAPKLEARIIDGDLVTRLEIDCPEATVRREAELWHLDMPPVLCVSFRPAASAGESARVLYARTDVLSGLGLCGGTYELVS